MRLRSLFVLCSAGLMFGVTSLHAQAPKFSNEFLAIGAGARAHGLSGALVASVDDGSAGYWNPAGLASLSSNFQLAAMHAEWFAGIGKYDYLSVARTLKSEKRKSAIGFTLIRFGVDNIPNTFNLVNPDGSVNFDNVTPFSAADYAFMASYGTALAVPGLSAGGTVKIIHRRVGKFAVAWGFGIDLGLQYRAGKNWLFGITARDVTSTFNAWQFSFTDQEQAVLALTGNEIPDNSLEVTRPRISLGSAYKTRIGNHISLLTEFDLDITTDGQRNTLINTDVVSIDPKFGIEAGYRDFVFVRGGVGNFQKATSNDPNNLSTVVTVQPNMGIGVRVGRFGIDYALTDIGDVSQTLYSHVFTLLIDFKATPKKAPGPRNKPKVPRRIIEQID